MVQVLIKNFIAPVSLVFRHTLYVLYKHSQTYTVVMVWKGWQGQILHKSQLSVCIVSYLCTDKGVQLKSKPKHTGTWSAMAWLSHCLWYHSAVFFSHLYHIAPSFPQGKNVTCVAKMLLFQFLCTFFKIMSVWNCMIQGASVVQRFVGHKRGRRNTIKACRDCGPTAGIVVPLQGLWSRCRDCGPAVGIVVPLQGLWSHTFLMSVPFGTWAYVWPWRIMSVDRTHYFCWLYFPACT